MELFASLSHIQNDIRGVCLLFELHHRNGSVCLCVSFSILQDGCAEPTFFFQFQNRTPIGCNRDSTCAAWIQKKKKEEEKEEVKIKHIFQPLCSVQTNLFSVWHTQYHTSTITDQIHQDGWAFFRILTFLAGLCPMGPCLVDFCKNQMAGIPQILICTARRAPTVQPFL